jgi:hypothetical protein
MEKGTWTQIMPSAPATSQRGYRWAGCVWEEVWERGWDAGREEKGEGIEVLRVMFVSGGLMAQGQ